MQKRWRLGAGGVAMAVAGLGLIALSLLLLAACGERQRLQLGDPAPDFSSLDQHGEPFTLADYQGRPVVLRFWSVDCKFCRADTPIFNRYYRQYREQGLVIIYISRNDDQEMVRRFIKDLEIEFPVIIDRGDRIAQQYRVKLDPLAVVIDPQHRLAAAVLGGVGEEELQRLLGGYLR
ncbi:peroxiredoxin family protein [Desulfurivibrio sp. D14AmB]|uniref:peroxiredoxin family protein n=1 Tax=Desulfurivibrio sp. D14AmB TaxID=3374370 RepID=UPI00376F259B